VTVGRLTLFFAAAIRLASSSSSSSVRLLDHTPYINQSIKNETRVL